MFNWILARIASIFNRPERPEAVKVGRLCYSCRKPIGPQGFVFDGKPWCSYFCIPAITRAKAAGVRP